MMGLLLPLAADRGATFDFLEFYTRMLPRSAPELPVPSSEHGDTEIGDVSL